MSLLDDMQGPPETGQHTGPGSDRLPESQISNDPDASPLRPEDTYEPAIYSAWLTWPLVTSFLASLVEIPYYALWSLTIALISFLCYLGHRRILRRPGRILVCGWLYLLLMSLTFRDWLLCWVVTAAHFRWLKNRDWPKLPDFRGRWSLLLPAVLLTGVIIMRCTVHGYIMGDYMDIKLPPDLNLSQYCIIMGCYRFALCSLGLNVMQRLYLLEPVKYVELPEKWKGDRKGEDGMPSVTDEPRQPATNSDVPMSQERLV